MKNSVLTVVMLLMVLSFGINAFAGVSAQAVNARLKQLVPADQPALFATGVAANGKDCEVSIGADARGEVEVMISARSMMGTRHYIFDLSRRTLTTASDNGTQIVVESINSEGSPEILVLKLVKDNDGRALKSAEIIQQASGIFGTKMKSLVNCSI